ncbi:MAG TPA: ParA family protein [Hyphomonadaceae bacterium]|nr:ParA family protein [Hyphomonadaceae bacterium]
MTEGVRVVVFASQKGGSGKTTLSGHIAVEAERAGDGPVALIDTDPQGSLAKWWNARAASTPAFAQASLEELDACLDHLKSIGFKLIVIDTPPAVTQTIAHVVKRADLVVVPTRPSPHDLRAVGPTVDIADSLNKSLVFVVNSATPRARITSETAVALSQHGVVAPVTLHHRVDFAASMIDGRTVGDIQPESKSALEVSALWLYLRGRLAKLYGGSDVHWGEKARADFSTAVLTPETPMQAPPAAVDEDDEDAWDMDLPAWANIAVANVTADRRKAGGPPRPAVAPGQAPSRAHAPGAVLEAVRPVETNALERRKSDRGPPAGQPDRRQARSFGRRPTH